MTSIFNLNTHNLEWDSLFMASYLIFHIVGIIAIFYITRNDQPVPSHGTGLLPGPRGPGKTVILVCPPNYKAGAQGQPWAFFFCPEPRTRPDSIPGIDPGIPNPNLFGCVVLHVVL